MGLYLSEVVVSMVAVYATATGFFWSSQSLKPKKLHQNYHFGYGVIKRGNVKIHELNEGLMGQFLFPRSITEG
jgi:hypothetical protein